MVNGLTIYVIDLTFKKHGYPIYLELLRFELRRELDFMSHEFA